MHILSGGGGNLSSCDTQSERPESGTGDAHGSMALLFSPPEQLSSFSNLPAIRLQTASWCCYSGSLRIASSYSEFDIDFSLVVRGSCSGIQYSQGPTCSVRNPAATFALTTRLDEARFQIPGFSGCRVAARSVFS